MLVMCAYVSQATKQLDLDGLNDIWLQSMERNDSIGVSGALLYNGADFVHVVEGEEDRVDTLVRKVMADDRHTEPKIIQMADITSRIFGHWPLKFMNIEDSTHLQDRFSRERFLSKDRGVRQSSLFRLVRL